VVVLGYVYFLIYFCTGDRVRLVGDNISANTTAIIDSLLVRAAIKGDPRMIRPLINDELRMGTISSKFF
jgi:hypothetical protein